MSDMKNAKPKFFVSHDAGGMHIWLSRVRPKIGEDGLYVCKEGSKMRLPYSYFGHAMRENTIRKLDIETMIIAAAEGKDF